MSELAQFDSLPFLLALSAFIIRNICKTKGGTEIFLDEKER
jgi:hypothetical protein